MEKRYKIRVNSQENIEVLLQEIYDEACRHFNEVQNEINKLANSVNLGNDNISIEEKTKYSKAMHEFIIDKKNAITMKLEITKFLGEIVKHNGDLNEAINSARAGKATKLDLGSLRSATMPTSTDNTATYNLK